MRRLALGRFLGRRPAPAPTRATPVSDIAGDLVGHVPVEALPCPHNWSVTDQRAAKASCLRCKIERPLCRARSGFNAGGFEPLCTRDGGHDGQHHNGFLGMWDESEAVARLQEAEARATLQAHARRPL